MDSLLRARMAGMLQAQWWWPWNGTKALTMALLICGATANALPAAEPAANVVGTAEVSADFRQEFHRAFATIPEPIWRGMSDRGWSVRLARFVSDASPQLTNERPRGWPGDRSWDEVEAVHLPASRTLIVAEQIRTRDGAGATNRRVAGVLRHEIGHAFDMYSAQGTRFTSASAEFRRAYHEDIAVLSPPERRELGYFLQRGAAGRQEAFAEAFAIQLGGGSDEAHRRAFCRAFPRVMSHVQMTIERYNQPRVAQLADQ